MKKEALSHIQTKIKKKKTRLELAKELSEYLNPKDIVEKKQKTEL